MIILKTIRLLDSSRLEARMGHGGMTSSVRIYPDGTEERVSILNFDRITLEVGEAKGPQRTEEAISCLALAALTLDRVEDASPDQVERIQLLISQMDGFAVRKWRA